MKNNGIFEDHGIQNKMAAPMTDKNPDYARTAMVSSSLRTHCVTAVHLFGSAHPLLHLTKTNRILTILTPAYLLR